MRSYRKYTSTESLIRHGHARPVEVSEGMDLLAKARENNLVQFGENIRERSTSFLPTIKRTMVTKQVKSRYLEALVLKFS